MPRNNSSVPQTLSIMTLPSPSASRQQIWSNAGCLFWPDASARKNSILWQLLSLYTDSANAFTTTVDALTLTQLGVSSKDENLLAHALSTYLGAVSKLRRELGRVSSRDVADTTLGTAYLLLYGQRFTPIASLSSGNNVSMHLIGLSQLLKLRGTAQSETQPLLSATSYFIPLVGALLPVRSCTLACLRVPAILLSLCTHTMLGSHHIWQRCPTFC